MESGAVTDLAAHCRYYRKMGTLQDSKLMLGNCGFAQPGFGRNEMCVWLLALPFIAL